MKTMFSVSRGEYSDYGVIGLFSTREKAEEALRRYGGDGTNSFIEEFSVDAMPECPPGRLLWYVTIQRDGSCRVRAAGADHANPQTGTLLPAIGPDTMAMTVWAKDEGHAAKIANEKRAQAIASNQWISWDEHCAKLRKK